MKKTYKIYLLCGMLFMLPGFFSCESLDKSPDSTVSEIEAFKNFTNFGIRRSIYNCIPDKEKCYWTLHGTGVMMK